jgi:hypothetical protein
MFSWFLLHVAGLALGALVARILVSLAPPERC